MINVTVPPNGLRHSLTQKCFETWILGFLPQITLEDTLKHLDRVIIIICLPLGPCSPNLFKYVTDLNSSKPLSGS